MLKAPESLAGQRARCPGCRALVDVPLPPLAPLQNEVPIRLEPMASSSAPASTPTPHRHKPAPAAGASPVAAKAPAAAPPAAPVAKAANAPTAKTAPAAAVAPPAPALKPEPASDLANEPGLDDLASLDSLAALGEPPAQAKKEGDDANYELAADLFTAPSTVTSSLEAGESPGIVPAPGLAGAPLPSGRKCSSCGAPLGATEQRCPRCGLEQTPDAANKRLEAMALRSSRYANQDKTKTFGNIAGVEITPKVLVVVALLVLMVTGVVYWWFTGPGANFILLEPPSIVFSVQPVPHIDDQSNPSATPAMFAPGTLVPGKAITKPPTAGSAPPQKEFSVDGNDALVIARPVDKPDDGSHVIIKFSVSQKLMQEQKMEERYDLMVTGDSFTIEGPGGPVSGIMLLDDVRSGVQLGLSDAKGVDPMSLVPAGHKPLYHEQANGGGTMKWDGTTGLKGKVDYRLIRGNSYESTATGYIAHGSLQLLDRGTTVDYTYNGPNMVVQWNKEHQGYHGTFKRVYPPDVNPFTKDTFTVIFPRIPEGKSGAAATARYELKIGGRAVMDVDGATIVEPTRKAGSQGPTVYKSGDALTQYLSSLNQAMYKAKGIVSGSNLQQLARGVLMYADSNGGKMPENIKDLETSLGGGFEALMTNNRTKEKPGFLYVKPAGIDNFNQIQQPNKTVIIYELFEGKPDPNGEVAFADGSIGPYPK